MTNFNLDDVKTAFGSFRLSAIEWGVLGLALAFAAVVGYYYYNTTSPLKTRLDYLRQEEKKLQANIKDDVTRDRELKEQQTNAEKILDSLGNFERRLHSRKTGIPTVIDEIHDLAKMHNVKAGDITFQTEHEENLGDAANPNAVATPKPNAVKDKLGKLPNVYEGLGIDTTVEGDYHDLRRFISALERSRNFVIVNAIALQSVDEKLGGKNKGNARSGFNNAPGAGLGQPGMPVNAPIGQPSAPLDAGLGVPTKTIVSLKIEMETHFARQEKIDYALQKISTSAPAASVK